MRHNQYDIPTRLPNAHFAPQPKRLPEDSKTREIRLPERPGAVVLRDIFDSLSDRITAMPRANDKKGMVLNYNGKLLIVKNIDIQSPSARGAATLYKMRFSDVRTGLKVEERFKATISSIPSP